jgi:glycosyltransferase involved in cell wall biosynthesis
MYKGNHIAVVIPAYNEEEFVGEVIETVPEFVDKIYPVDDCSTDCTWQEIQRAAERVHATADPTEPEQLPPVTDGGHANAVIPVQLTRNRGVGGAIKEGYRRAMADGADVVSVMNGDGQMDPDELDRLLDPVVEGAAAYAKGNRLKSSDHWKGMTRWRLFGNVLLTQLTRIASGYWDMKDPQNGYTAVSTAALEKIDLDSLYEEYGFLNDMLIRLNANDMRIADVEMEAIYGDESSSIRYSQFVPNLSWLLLTMFIWRLQSKYADGHRMATAPYLAGILGGGITSVGLFVHLVVGDLYSTATVILVLAGFLALIGVGMVVEWQRNSVLQLTVSE